MELRGKVVVVSGGTSGIGLGVARAFLLEGATVAVLGSREHPAEDASGGATAPGAARDSSRSGSPGPDELKRFVCDITDRPKVQRTFREISSTLGTIDILVNSAGTNVANRSMHNLDPAEFDRLLAVNTTGTFNCIYEVLPGMRAKKEGLIINIVSVAGKRVLELAGAPYCVSKFATAALGTYVGLEDTKNGIRVTNIYPGETDTPIIDKRPVPPTPERRAAMLRPEDIAMCALLVAKLPLRANVPELVITPAHMLLG